MRPCRLLASPLQVIVERRIFELGEVQRRGMAHQPFADVVREEIAQQRFDECRRAREELPAECDRHLDRDITPEYRDRPPARVLDHIDDELADPQRGDRDQGANDAQYHHRNGVAAMGGPDEAEELRQ